MALQAVPNAVLGDDLRMGRGSGLSGNGVCGDEHVLIKSIGAKCGVWCDRCIGVIDGLAWLGLRS